MSAMIENEEGRIQRLRVSDRQEKVKLHNKQSKVWELVLN